MKIKTKHVPLGTKYSGEETRTHTRAYISAGIL